MTTAVAKIVMSSSPGTNLSHRNLPRKEYLCYYCRRLAWSLKFIFELHEITFNRWVIRSLDIDRKFGFEQRDSLYHICKECYFSLNFIRAFESEQLSDDEGEFASPHVLKEYLLTQADALLRKKSISTLQVLKSFPKAQNFFIMW